MLENNLSRRWIPVESLLPCSYQSHISNSFSPCARRPATCAWASISKRYFFFLYFSYKVLQIVSIFSQDLHLRIESPGWGYGCKKTEDRLSLDSLSAVQTLRLLHIESSPFLAENSLAQLNCLHSLHTLHLRSSEPSQPNLSRLQLTHLEHLLLESYLQASYEDDMKFVNDSLRRMRNLKSLTIGVVSNCCHSEIIEG